MRAVRAFPSSIYVNDPQQGMLLRDYFAVKAMQALVTRVGITSGVYQVDMAREAYVIADAMMAEREKV